MPLYALIKFNYSAFKHGVTEADIIRAFETFIYEDPIEDAINVFHAMPCRKSFRELVEE